MRTNYIYKTGKFGRTTVCIHIIKMRYRNSGTVVNMQRKFIHKVGRYHDFNSQVTPRTIERL